MKKIKTNNLVVALSSCVLIFASIALYSFPKSSSDKVDKSPINQDYQENKEIGLNYKDVKFKNNGDTFILSAYVNEDATIKSVRFVSDRPDCVSVTRKTENSVTLTRLKSFTGIVKITATPDDPFVDFKETCDVRCYNNFMGFGDVYSSFLINGSPYQYYDSDEILLAENKTTRVIINANTEFGENEQPFNDGTFTNIEEYDFNYIKEEVEKIFAPNQIKNFVQRDNSISMENAITFDIVYTSDLFNNQNSITKTFSLNNSNCIFKLIKYVPVSDFDFSVDSTIVI